MTTFARRLQPTIRVRLTLLYGGLFLAGGLVLLTMTYFLVKNGIQHQPAGVTAVRIDGTTKPTEVVPRLSSGVRPVPGKPSPDTVYTAGQAEGMIVKARAAARCGWPPVRGRTSPNSSSRTPAR